MTALLPDHRYRHDTVALSGLLCAVAFVGGLLVTGLLVGESAPPNMPGSAPADIQRYFLANAEIARVQALTQTAAAILLLVFTGVLAARIRELDGPAARLAPIAHAGGVLAAAFLAFSALLAGTLGAERIATSPATVSALRQLSFFVGGAGHTVWIGVLVGAVAVAANRARVLPRWLTSAGLVSATLSLLSLVSIVVEPAALFIPVGRFSALLFLAVTSVLMVTGRTERKAGRGSAAAPIAGGVGVVVLAFALTVFV